MRRRGDPGQDELRRIRHGFVDGKFRLLPTHNPRDLTRVPGGSSGGVRRGRGRESATVALGSDTGGSIRQPASFCGIVGMMGTYGRVSRYGLVAFASSLDHIGPFRALGARRGRYPGNHCRARPERFDLPPTLPVTDYEAAARTGHSGTEGRSSQRVFQGLESGDRGNIQQGIDLLAKLGCEVVPISLPHTDYAIGCYYIICTAEASSNLARYDGVRYGFRSTRPD